MVDSNCFQYMMFMNKTNVFRQLFELNQQNSAELMSAIEQAVIRVEPQLKLTRMYPKSFRKPVLAALEYSHSLAYSLPGPVAIDPESYARNAYVHAIFPSMNIGTEIFRSSPAVQQYLHKHPDAEKTYALMGMRRHEKILMGMELSGQVIQRDVPQHVVYFAEHTVVDPAPGEKQVRDQAAWRFFYNLVGNVVKRAASRKRKLQTQLEEMDLLKERLHTSSRQTRPALERELSGVLASAQRVASSLDLNSYVDDFEAVLSNPAQYLQLKQFPMVLDSMGVSQDGSAQGEQILFADLTGYDERDWTVTLVYCHNLKPENFASRLAAAQETL